MNNAMDNQSSRLPGTLLTAIVLTGIVAGTLDISAAIINFYLSGGSHPIRIFFYIASGVFGSSAYAGGFGMAMLGLVFHYSIATTWSAIFFAGYPRFHKFLSNKFINAILYGVIVWVTMTFVVLPLSKVQQFPFSIERAIIAAGILVVCIGLPIAWMAEKYYSMVQQKT